MSKNSYENKTTAMLQGIESDTQFGAVVAPLVAYPGTMTHAAMDSQAQKIAGLSDFLARLSAGIESVADLIGDLKLSLLRVQDAKLKPQSLHRIGVSEVQL